MNETYDRFEIDSMSRPEHNSSDDNLSIRGVRNNQLNEDDESRRRHRESSTSSCTSITSFIS